MDWVQTIATIASVLAVGVSLLAYITRQFNRIGDQLVIMDNRIQNVEKQQVSFNERFDRIEDRFDRIEDRFSQIDRRLDRMDSRINRLEERLEEALQDVRGDLQNLGIEQARMLGFLEGRGVMTKTAVEAERAS